MPTPPSLWDNNLIQFARVIEEAQAAGAFELEDVIKSMCDSMDLEKADLLSLLERARIVWEDAKAAVSPKRFNHAVDLAFEIESNRENIEGIPLKELCDAARARIDRIEAEGCYDPFGQYDTIDREAGGDW